MRLIRSSSYRRQQWKNGGGETIEIAVYPHGATTSDFDWRVSMARVETDGPFSAFPDIDRTLSILHGQGIELSVDGQEPVTISDRPHSFPGDVATSARLLDGPITDLNVMTRRGRFRHRVTSAQLVDEIDMVVRSPIALLYCADGTATIEDEFAPPFDLAAGDTLHIEAQPNSLRLTAKLPTTLFLVEIVPF